MVVWMFLPMAFPHRYPDEEGRPGRRGRTRTCGHLGVSEALGSPALVYQRLRERLLMNCSHESACPEFSCCLATHVPGVQDPVVNLPSVPPE